MKMCIARPSPNRSGVGRRDPGNLPFWMMLLLWVGGDTLSEPLIWVSSEGEGS